MIAHQALDQRQTIPTFDVNAMDVFDLRSADAIEHVLKNASDPFFDWQAIAASSGEPRRGASGIVSNAPVRME